MAKRTAPTMDIVHNGDNIYSQGIDPTLALGDMDRNHKCCSSLHLVTEFTPRHPYAGGISISLLFWALTKACPFKKLLGESKLDAKPWDVASCQIDPRAIVGRSLQEVIRPWIAIRQRWYRLYPWTEFAWHYLAEFTGWISPIVQEIAEQAGGGVNAGIHEKICFEST